MKLDQTIKNTHPTFTIGEHKSARRYRTMTPPSAASAEAPTEELDPRISAAIREAIGGQVKELSKVIKDSSSANSDLAAGLVIRGEQAKDGAQVGYDNPNNNRAPYGMTWSAGQNSTYSAGQMPGMTTPFREVYVARPVPAGNKSNSGGAAWYQAKIPIESLPPGTVFATGDGTTEYIDENGEAKVVLPYQLGTPGEPIDMGQINYPLLKKFIERKFPNTGEMQKVNGVDKDTGEIARENLLKEYGYYDAISDKSASFPWMRVMANGLGKPEPFQPNFYAIRYKKDNFFHYKNVDGDNIKIKLRNNPATGLKEAVHDPVDGEEHFGFVRTNRRFIREQVVEKDPATGLNRTVWKYRRNGQNRAGDKNPTDNFLATDGFEYENADGTGKAKMKFYMLNTNQFDEPMIQKDSNGNEYLVEINDPKALPQVEQEGLMGRDGKIIDPRKMFLDNGAPIFGFRKESISMENTRRVWSFKRTLLVDTSKSLDEQKEQVDGLPQELKQFVKKVEDTQLFGKKHVGYNLDQSKGLVVEVDKGGRKVKYRLVQDRDYDALRKFNSSNNPSNKGQAPSQFYAYELDNEGLPIPEIKLPEIGLETDLKNQPGNPLYKDSMFQHFTGNYQPALDGKQSDGSSQVSRGMYWHGRAIDRNRARHMLTYLDDIQKNHSVGATVANWLFKLGYETKKDFLPNTRFSIQEFGQRAEVYQRMREASSHDLRASKDGTHTDNQVTIWYEYAFSRCISDLVNGTNRAVHAATEATAVGVLGSGLAGVGCLALGMTALPTAAVLTSAFVMTGYLWNSTTFQHSRRRKDTITVEELESHADTSLIYGKYGENTKLNEVLLYDRKKTMGLFNTVGIQNDIYVALRGLFGAMYLWNGAYMGIDKMQERAGQYAAGATAAGVTTALSGLGLASAASIGTTLGVSASIVTTTALSLTGVGALGVLALSAVSGTYYLRRYMATEGKAFGEAVKDEFAVLKPKYYNWDALSPDSVKKHKDTFQRLGFAKRAKESRYTLSVAGI